jgi:hypothetical protein
VDSLDGICWFKGESLNDEVIVQVCQALNGVVPESRLWCEHTCESTNLRTHWPSELFCQASGPPVAQHSGKMWEEYLGGQEQMYQNAEDGFSRHSRMSLLAFLLIL